MADNNTDNAAVMQGFTKPIMVDCDIASFAALVKPDTDFDGSFKAFNTDDQEWLTVNGWLCLIEELELDGEA